MTIKIREDKQPDVSQDIEVWLEEEGGVIALKGRNVGSDDVWNILFISEEGIERAHSCLLNGITKNHLDQVVDVGDD